MNVQIILSQMLMLFVMMLIGYFLWKKQWLDEPANQKLSKIVVNKQIIMIQNEIEMLIALLPIFYLKNKI